MINVFSAFDGCSGAKVALDRLGIQSNYYASEIDKWAIKISQKNHPDIVRMGDIRGVNPLDLPQIDLMIGGSPCQDLSKSGKMGGLQGSRSGLFYEFAWLLSALQPKYFLVENVVMKYAWQWVFSLYTGVKPIRINSSLVSAQMRDRLYWTNIPGVEQPADRGILLKDIIEDGIVDRDKSYCIDANYYKGGSVDNCLNKKRRQVVLAQSENRLMVYTRPHGYVQEKLADAEKYPTLTVDPNSKHLVCVPDRLGDIGPYQQDRVYSMEGKSVCLKANGGGRGAKTGLYLDGYTVRMLTPVECERLQTYPDGYTEGVSKTQRYKMLGNSFTVEVIKHILSYMEA